MEIRVALADKDYLVAQSVAVVLEAERDIAITGIYTDGQALMRGLSVREPDVLVLDPMGTSLLQKVRAAHPRTHVVVLTSSQRERHLFAAVRAGVRGYLSKSASIGDLLGAIRAAARGLATLTPREAAQLMDAFARQSHEETGLTPRQREILSGIVQGKTDREIAREVGLTEKTVKNYMGGLFSALGVRNRTDAAVCALQLDLVSEKDWALLEERAEIQRAC